MKQAETVILQLQRELVAARERAERCEREDAIKASVNRQLLERAERAEAERDAAVKALKQIEKETYFQDGRTYETIHAIAAAAIAEVKEG